MLALISTGKVMKLNKVVNANSIMPASNSCGKEFSIKIPASSNHVIHCEAKETTGTSLLRIVNGAYARACCTAWPHSWAATAAAMMLLLL